MKKLYKLLFMGAVAASGFTSCNSQLDVTDPNKFTDEQIEENILKSGDETKIKKAMEGMANGMTAYIMEYLPDMTGGYANSDATEMSFEYAHAMLMGDIIEGSQDNQGHFYRWYTNDPGYTFWSYDQIQGNFGNYIASVKKIAAAMNVLQFLTDDVVGNNALLKEYRARCLTVEAYAYMELMERYTDLQDVTSTTKQGWPIYTKYAYNAPIEPSSVADTWKQILTWLKQAVKDFEDSGIGTGGYTIGLTETENYDIDAGVANYILARAALDCKDYSTVVTACTDLLSHYPNFIKEANYGMNQALLEQVAQRNDNGFVKNFNAKDNAFFCLAVNPETIFGWNASATTNSAAVSQLSAMHWYFANPLHLIGTNLSADGYIPWQIDNALYNQMSDNDFRKNCFSTKVVSYPFYKTTGKDTTLIPNDLPKYTSTKFAATDPLGYTNHNTGYTVSDVSYFRSSAALLMLAEAYAQQGNDGQAKLWLNKLLAARTKTGATTMTCDNTMSGKSALDMVKLQWRIEMWGERDWVFVNAKRWNEVPPRAGTNQWSQTKVQIPHMTLEIPDAERISNPYWK